MKRVLSKTWESVMDPVRVIRILAQLLNQRLTAKFQTSLSNFQEHDRQYKEYSHLRNSY